MSAPTPPPGDSAPDPYAAPDPNGAASAEPASPSPTVPAPPTSPYPEPYAQQAPYTQGSPYPQQSPYGQQPPVGQQGPYGQPTPYGEQAPYGQRPPGTDGFSITALITGILWLSPFAIGFGIAGLRRTRRTGRSGRGLAIAGIVLGALGMVGWLLFIGLVVLAVNSDEFQDSFREGYDGAYSAQTGANLAVGDCFEPPADVTELEDVVTQTCTTAHGAELVGVHDMTDAEFPGADSVETSAADVCYEQFADYVGTDYDSSSLDMIYLYPTESSWAIGDRRVLCWAEPSDGVPLEGSVAGSGL